MKIENRRAIGLIVLIVVSAQLLGCITSPSRPKDWYEPEWRIRWSPWTGLDARNTKDFAGHCTVELDPETGKITRLDIQVENTASVVNQSQEALMREWTKQQQQQIDGLKWVVEQWKTHGENIDKILGRVVSMVDTLASMFNIQLTKDGLIGGNQLAPPQPVAPAPTEDQIADVVRRVLDERRSAPNDPPPMESGD